MDEATVFVIFWLRVSFHSSHTLRSPAGEQHRSKSETTRKDGELERDRHATASGHGLPDCGRVWPKEQIMQGKQLKWFEHVLDSTRAEFECELRQ
jgi:hypothetical protein